ncbi:hypothetical protein [Streptosporangium minutum]|uniref:Uncharacterized protein n=1 Tax=Streptosporangium minutum TaxID=569862 RepID=A0A243RW74_9ACTN|nr:hypothetical protein [Streptosporangium minutum]OUC98746.1 hypothetical protein CA984_05715 [Streptosporangium minutum]
MPLAFAAGAVVGVLGRMIGLGGAEFRLPLLIGLFGFAALSPEGTSTPSDDPFRPPPDLPEPA